MFILFNDIFNVVVFLMLMLILYWGMLLSLFGCMFISFGFCVVVLSSWLCVCIKVLCLWFVIFSNCILKFDVFFSLWIGGGKNVKVLVLMIWVSVG